MKEANDSKDSKSRRKHRRIKIENLSKIHNTNISVINVSKEGLLVATNFELPDQTVDIQLKISGKWVDLHGTVMWLITHPVSNQITMGIFIKKAPPEYNDFIDNLYLEAAER